MAYKKASELKKGNKVILDGVLCEIVSIELSALGKHGTKKVRIIATSEEGETKIIIKPSDVLVESR